MCDNTVSSLVLQGRLQRKNTIIPAYVNIKLSLAVGLRLSIQEAFEKVLADFKFAAAVCRNECIAGQQGAIYIFTLYDFSA